MSIKCPLLINKMSDMKYDIYGTLISFTQNPICKLTGGICGGCTEVVITNRNESSIINLIRPDNVDQYEVKYDGKIYARG